MIGTATSKVLKNLGEQDQKKFFMRIRQYFCEVCDYIIRKFPIIIQAKEADMSVLPDASFSDVKYFLDRFPAIMKLEFGNEDFDTSVDALESQFCNLQLEDLEEKKNLKGLTINEVNLGKLKMLMEI